MLVQRLNDIVDHQMHMRHRLDNLFHHHAGLIDQLNAFVDAARRFGNELRNLFCCVSAPLGQVTDFTGHHRKTASLLTRPCGFYGSV